MKFDIHYNTSNYYRKNSTIINDRESGHLHSKLHQKNQERLGFYNNE